MVNAQEWLEKYYPDKETGTIHINQQLEGVLDCREYKELRKIFISTQVDGSKFEIKKGSCREWNTETRKYDIIKETKIIPCILAQNYLNQNYPTKQERAETTYLDINWKGLEGNLDLSDFSNLEILYCHNNYLTQIVYPPNPEKITYLSIRNNNLSLSDLTTFSPMRNLISLYISNIDENKISQGIYNRIEGSCEPLKDLNKLERLDISNTDINSGWEYLPDSLKDFYYDTDCKLTLATTELEKELWKDIHKDFAPKYKKCWLDQGFSKEQTKEIFEKGSRFEIKPKESVFLNWFLNFKKLDLDWAKENEEEFKQWRGGYEYFGTCQECQQPNTSRRWCHSCNAKHFQEDFNNWTSGNPQIDKFIQKCQLEATSDWNVLEWIPYEKFTNIEHVADGGFGKVEKAEWQGGIIIYWNKADKNWKRSKDYEGNNKYKNYKTVALKTLSNSQNLNQEFLSELILYKMFNNSVSNMVPCYGVSKNNDGNYILVMEYMNSGNLREYLKKNYWMGLESKLKFLHQIIQGLKDIHRKKLVHRDFHSGNIIVDGGSCCITDLGLSKPANKTDDNQVFGIVPYVAPEVLSGKPYTQAADIYSLGMIMYEVITCLPPFAEQAHDLDLSLRICQGIRPQFPEQIKYPQLLVDLIKRCWDNEPNNRPTAKEISGIFGEWFEEWGSLKSNTEFSQQHEEAENHNKTLPYKIKYPTYQSLENWHSKPINTKEITQRLTERYGDSSLLELTIPTQELNIQDQEQAQIEIPPKQN